MIQLEVVHDGSAVARRIDMIAKRAEHPSPLMWRRVGSYMRQVYRRQFATQGAYLGTPWKPLSPRYASWKVAHGGRGKILNFSGDLRRSYTVEAMAETTYYGPRSVAFGSSHRLAAFHEYGTHSHKTGRKILPARPVVVETPKIRRDIKKIVSNYLMGNGRAALPGL